MANSRRKKRSGQHGLRRMSLADKMTRLALRHDRIMRRWASKPDGWSPRDYLETPASTGEGT